MSQQRKAPTSCWLFDFDDFKQINVTYGHKVGDYVLEIFGGILSDHLPGSVYGRLGERSAARSSLSPEKTLGDWPSKSGIRLNPLRRLFSASVCV
ncbi:GGDEF domain-containing protein (plasmid) [Microvirga sp. RSM25]|uniref:GGDEF domain-containing protein n=1 Tax=Microvirga sp. RSM25 TaxID=3273802 RepID=UPI003850D341